MCLVGRSHLVQSVYVARLTYPLPPSQPDLRGETEQTQLCQNCTLYVHNTNTFRSSTHIYNNSSNCNKQEHKLKQTRGCVRADHQRYKQKKLSVCRQGCKLRAFIPERCKVQGDWQREPWRHLSYWRVTGCSSNRIWNTKAAFKTTTTKTGTLDYLFDLEFSIF